MPIKVLLVDDHKIVREGVRAYLHTLADIQVIAEADSGTAAIIAVEQYQPDVVLMDLEMPDKSAVLPGVPSPTTSNSTASP